MRTQVRFPQTSKRARSNSTHLDPSSGNQRQQNPEASFQKLQEVSSGLRKRACLKKQDDNCLRKIADIYLCPPHSWEGLGVRPPMGDYERSLTYSSVPVKRHHGDSSNSYKRKRLIRDLLTVLEVSPLSSWQGADRHGSRAVAESYKF